MRGEQPKSHEHKYYVDRDERILRDDEVNKHHLIFPRHVYMGSVALQQFRGSGGFIQRISIPAHRDLHHHVRHPILVCHNLRSEIIRLQFPLQDRDPLERLDITMAYLGKLAGRDGIMTNEMRDAWDLLENLQQQRIFIDSGRVVPLEEV